jgi:glycine/serine hydroxymethyltransferase
MSIFDLDKNQKLLETLKPDVVMVGLNFSRTIEKKAFVNFHDKRPQG